MKLSSALDGTETSHGRSARIALLVLKAGFLLAIPGGLLVLVIALAARHAPRFLLWSRGWRPASAAKPHDPPTVV